MRIVHQPIVEQSQSNHSDSEHHQKHQNHHHHHQQPPHHPRHYDPHRDSQQENSDYSWTPYGLHKARRRNNDPLHRPPTLTVLSVLLIERLRSSDAGQYACKPSYAEPANTTVRVISGTK